MGEEETVFIRIGAGEKRDERENLRIGGDLFED
jgi:hypothetical protein